MTKNKKPRTRLLRNGAIALIVVLILIAAGMFQWDKYATGRVVDDYPPRGEFVTVGASRMHILCQGSGEPAVVFQAGIAGGALDWLPVMQELSHEHQVCAFDRLGQDWSAPAPVPRTFATAADEWGQAIDALGIERPVVVGHSLGGAIAQIYAGRNDVAGIVLVDGLSRDVAEPVVNRLGMYQKLDWLGKAGLLRFLGALFADGAYPSDLRTEMAALRSRSSAILDISAEGALAAETVPEELRQAELDMQAPLLIIAAGNSELPEAEQFLQALQNLHERYHSSTIVMVPDAKHYVIASHPALVAETIADWIQKEVSE